MGDSRSVVAFSTCSGGITGRVSAPALGIDVVIAPSPGAEPSRRRLQVLVSLPQPSLPVPPRSLRRDANWQRRSAASWTSDEREAAQCNDA